MMSPGWEPRAGGTKPRPPLGPEPIPLALQTNSRLPSLEAWTNAQNQPAGMYPASWRFARSTTATAFSPAQAA